MAEGQLQTNGDQLAEEVVLQIGEQRHVGWTGVTVTRALDQITGTFTLELVPVAGTEEADIDVREGDRCSVLLGGETVIDGWIDSVISAIGPQSRSLRVSGRDRTGDLADCAAIHKPGSWRNATLGTIARALVAPFGLPVTIEGDDPKVDRFALQQGERVQEALERLVRFRGLLMMAGPAGELVFAEPTKDGPVARIETGLPLLSEASFDASERFSDYVVKGQAGGDDDRNGRAVTQLSGKSRDTGVMRYRPQLIIAEDQGGGASMSARAAWEAGVRRGRSTTVTVSMLGWRTSRDGPLWQPNTRVEVDLPRVRVGNFGEMLVTAVTYEKSESGTIATLTLMPPEAWQQLKGGAV